MFRRGSADVPQGFCKGFAGVPQWFRKIPQEFCKGSAGVQSFRKRNDSAGVPATVLQVFHMDSAEVPQGFHKCSAKAM